MAGYRAVQLLSVNFCSYFEIFVISKLSDICFVTVQQQRCNSRGHGHRGFEERQYYKQVLMFKN